MKKVFAQTLKIPSGDDSQIIEGPLVGFDSLGTVITKAIPYIFAFAGFALLLMLVRAGYTFLTSAGDAKKLESGKQQITYALVGFLVIFASFWIVQVVGTILGFDEVTGLFN